MDAIVNDVLRRAQNGQTLNTWADYIEIAMSILGGEASLSDLYKTVGILRVAHHKSLPVNFTAIIRRQLQEHFRPIARGRWGRRGGQWTPQ